MSKIAIDCDGVLADYVCAFNEIVNKLFPGRLPHNFIPQHYDGWRDYLSAEEFAQAMAKQRATENFWLGLNPYSANVIALARWFIVAQDHEVYYVTSRSPGPGMTVARQTDWWVRSCGLMPVHNYVGIIVAPKSDRKVEIYDAAGFDYSVDDKAETVEQCDGLENHKAYLLDQPWNQDAKVKRRVRSLEGFLKDIR